MEGIKETLIKKINNTDIFSKSIGNKNIYLLIIMTHIFYYKKQ